MVGLCATVSKLPGRLKLQSKQSDKESSNDKHARGKSDQYSFPKQGRLTSGETSSKESDEGHLTVGTYVHTSVAIPFMS